MLIIAGIEGIILGLSLAVITEWLDFSELAGLEGMEYDLTGIFLVGGVVWMIFGIMALLGGIMAIQRKGWGVALLGSIFGLFCLGLVIGIEASLMSLIALILIIMSKDEFS